MKIHRFIGDFDISKETVAIADMGLTHQMFRVLKLEPDEVITLSNGHGIERNYRILSISKKEVSISAIDESIVSKKAPVPVTLFASVLKKENFDLIVQKATEIGVIRIIPITTERTIKQNINKDRLEKIAHEASEQSGRGDVPNISDVISFEEAIKMKADFTEAWILHITGGVHSENKNIKNRAIMIGPEGGFTDKELASAEEFGWKMIRISPLTFRGETAAIIGTYLACGN